MQTCHTISCFLFFSNDTATTEIYTLSLHDALPICGPRPFSESDRAGKTHTRKRVPGHRSDRARRRRRSEEHTSELQSPDHLVCRLLLEKKKKKRRETSNYTKNVSIPTRLINS